MNNLLRPSTQKLMPLSEDTRLVLATPRFLRVEVGESKDWDEVTRIAKGEKRVISLDVLVSAQAHGRMVRTFYVPKGARLIVLHKVRVEEAGSWQMALCVRGEGEVLVRRALDVSGVGASAEVVCAGVLNESGHISVADEIFCLAPKARVQVRTKIVLNDAARSEARARIVVDSVAEQTTAHERLDHMLFGERATAVAIPELEVQTDNVTCGHGATTSRPGEKETFYLTTRGLSQAVAEQVLAQGFIADALINLPEAQQQAALAVLFD